MPTSSSPPTTSATSHRPWQPPTSLLNGLPLPGGDPADIDINQLHQLIRHEGHTLGEGRGSPRHHTRHRQAPPSKSGPPRSLMPTSEVLPTWPPRRAFPPDKLHRPLPPPTHQHRRQSPNKSGVDSRVIALPRPRLPNPGPQTRPTTHHQRRPRLAPRAIHHPAPDADRPRPRNRNDLVHHGPDGHSTTTFPCAADTDSTAAEHNSPTPTSQPLRPSCSPLSSQSAGSACSTTSPPPRAKPTIIRAAESNRHPQGEPSPIGSKNSNNTSAAHSSTAPTTHDCL